MRILVIGDPHGDLEKIKSIPIDKVDIILLTGDLGSANLMRKMAFENIERKKQGLKEIKYSSAQNKKGFMEAYNSTLKLINYLSKFAPVWTIFGNVESSDKKTRRLSKEWNIKLPFMADALSKKKNVKIINNTVNDFNNLKIGGLEFFKDINWVKEFKPSDYKKEMEIAIKQTIQAKKYLTKFREIDFLICHQPPYGYLDKVTAKFAPLHWQGKNAGSKTILNFIKKNQPKYVFCGHIHEGVGEANIGKTKVYNLGVAGYKIIEL